MKSENNVKRQLRALYQIQTPDIWYKIKDVKPPAPTQEPVKIKRYFSTQTAGVVAAALIFIVGTIFMLHSLSPEDKPPYTSGTFETQSQVTSRQGGDYISEELKQRVKNDWYEQKVAEDPIWGTNTVEGVWLDNFFYGYFNGSVVFHRSGEAQGGWTEEVAELTFAYGNSGRILIWNNGKFYTLSGLGEFPGAYTTGILTKEDLEEIHYLHQQEFPFMYETQGTTSPVTVTTEPVETTETTTATTSNTPPKDDTKEEFRKFIQNNEINERGLDEATRTRESVRSTVVSNVFIPSNRLLNFELTDVTYKEDVYIGLYYTNKNYKSNNKLDESENHARSTAIYEISELMHTQESLERFYQWGFKPLNLDDRVIYHMATYSISDSSILLNHGFEFIEGDKRIRAWLPAIDGLSAYDMLKYLDMVKVQ